MGAAAAPQAGGSSAESGAASGPLCREHGARRQRGVHRGAAILLGGGSGVHWLIGA